MAVELGQGHRVCKGYGKESVKARDQSKAGKRTGWAKVVDGTRSEVMAGVGKSGTRSKGNAGRGWGDWIRMGEHSRSDICVRSVLVSGLVVRLREGQTREWDQPPREQ